MLYGVKANGGVLHKLALIIPSDVVQTEAEDGLLQFDISVTEIVLCLLPSVALQISMYSIHIVKWMYNIICMD